MFTEYYCDICGLIIQFLEEDDEKNNPSREDISCFCVRCNKMSAFVCL
jgi:hypothetical protein